MRHRTLLALLLLCSASPLTGCMTLAEDPPVEEPQAEPPALRQLSPAVERLAQATLPVLARDSAERRARELTVRLRNTGCEGVRTGSGFALDRETLITNRHVLAGADELQTSTWDGRSLSVRFAEVGSVADLGIAVVEGTLPRVGRFGPPPRPGDTVTAVGYPLGRKLTLTRGTVIDRTNGGRFDIPGQVLRLTAEVQPGNSGGPVLDAKGRVIGVVFAIEIATGLTLAIPAETFQSLVIGGDFEPIPGCGHE